MQGSSDEIAERLFHGVEKIASVISEVVFPHQLYCICCGNIIDSTRSYSLCDHCMEHIRWNVDEPRNIDGMRVMRCADYGIYERSIIFAFKYDGHKYIARDIARIMADRLRIEGFKSSDENMLIVPVPLHENKYLVRGFNQSKLIGKYLAKEMDLKLSDVLLRVHETKALRGLGAAERAETIAGSMELIKASIDLVQDKDIMLVDDFFTTGSTARECRRAIEKGKPKSVSLIAFAGREWREAIKLSEEVI
ncbi:MAG: ComF family protein [Firmicutes bacterium]|nr:ComF family protein [Bacillota bacterium]